MGFFEKLLRPTPFYNTYKKIIQKKGEKEQERLEKSLHPLRVQFYKQFIQPSDIVFDIGANVGNRVSSFLACNATVVAVEPQPNCVKILEEKFGSQIRIENVGLSDKEGELEMYISTDSTISTFNKQYVESTKDRFKYSRWVNTVNIPVTTLDALIIKYGVPKFCKIDVEGFEFQVLKGLHTDLPFLSIEYCVPEMQKDLEACIKYLHGLAPAGKFNYSVGESMVWAKQNWFGYDQFLDHVKTAEFIQTSFGDIYFQSNAPD